MGKIPESHPREELKVTAVGVEAQRDLSRFVGTRNKAVRSVCNTVVMDDAGKCWFIPSRGLELARHTITIDDRVIEVSAESFANLQRQLAR